MGRVRADDGASGDDLVRAKVFGLAGSLDEGETRQRKGFTEQESKQWICQAKS